MIAKAKTHFANTVARGATPPSPENFPHVRVREAVIVSFHGEDKRDQVWVLMDRADGKFIGGWSRIRGASEGHIHDP